MSLLNISDFCHVCKKTDIQEWINCSCETAQYCSADCKQSARSNHRDFCQRIKRLSLEIKNLHPGINIRCDIEEYAYFIRKKLEFAYLLWYMAEKTESYVLFEKFLKYATEIIRVKPFKMRKILLYRNNVIGSHSLVHYIIMALVTLGRYQEAYGIAKFYILKWFIDEKAVISQKKQLKPGEWLTMPNQDPFENTLKLMKLHPDIFPPEETFFFGALGEIFANLIPIKIECINEMEKKIDDLKVIKEIIDTAPSTSNLSKWTQFKKTYPELNELDKGQRNITNIVLGTDEATFNAKLKSQKRHLKLYMENTFFKMSHRVLFDDVLLFDKNFTQMAIERHLNENITDQSLRYGSLGSCWCYFDRLFRNENNTSVKIIRSVVSKTFNFYFQWPTDGIRRLFPVRTNELREVPSHEDANLYVFDDEDKEESDSDESNELKADNNLSRKRPNEYKHNEKSPKCAKISVDPGTSGTSKSLQNVTSDNCAFDSEIKSEIKEEPLDYDQPGPSGVFNSFTNVKSENFAFDSDIKSEIKIEVKEETSDDNL